MDALISSSRRVFQGSRIPIPGEVACWLKAPGNTTGYHLYQDIEWGSSYGRLSFAIIRVVVDVTNCTHLQRTSFTSSDHRPYLVKSTLTDPGEAVPTEFAFGK